MKKLFTTFAIVVVTLFPSVMSRSIENSVLNCYIKHLKAAKKLNVNYPENAVNNNLNCSDLIIINNNKLYQQIATNALSDSLFNNYSECLMTELRASNVADDYMARLVYSVSNLTSVEKQRKDQDIKQDIKVNLRNAVKSCKVYQQIHENQFNQFFKIFSEGAKDPLKEYCVKKHVLENKLINTKVYNVPLNSTGLNITESTCERVLERFAERFTTELIGILRDNGRGFTDSELDCFLGRLQRAKFMEKILAIGVLCEINITEAQKAEERKKFVGFMEAASPYDCVM